MKVDYVDAPFAMSTLSLNSCLPKLTIMDIKFAISTLFKNKGLVVIYFSFIFSLSTTSTAELTSTYE